MYSNYLTLELCFRTSSYTLQSATCTCIETCSNVYGSSMELACAKLPQDGLQQRAKKKTPWSESPSELYRPSGHRLSAKRLPTFADKGCHVVSVTDPYGFFLGFLDRSRYFSIK
jgi:hypothetical protein